MVLYIKAYVGSLIVFLGLDFLWLGIIAKNFYAGHLGGLMRDDINVGAAGGFYFAYIAGVVFFAVTPALAADSWTRALLNGALLGLLAYGTYDMTNIATLKGWPVTVSIVDMIWGTALTGAAAVAGYFAARVF